MCLRKGSFLSLPLQREKEIINAFSSGHSILNRTSIAVALKVLWGTLRCVSMFERIPDCVFLVFRVLITLIFLHSPDMESVNKYVLFEAENSASYS